MIRYSNITDEEFEALDNKRLKEGEVLKSKMDRDVYCVLSLDTAWNITKDRPVTDLYFVKREFSLERIGASIRDIPEYMSANSRLSDYSIQKKLDHENN